MNKSFSQQSLIELGKLTKDNLILVEKCRGVHNKLGFAYQLIFIRLLNITPCQSPFEIIDEIVIYASTQLSLEVSLIQQYSKNRKKISSHQQSIINHLQLKIFNDCVKNKLNDYIFKQSLQFESASILQIKSIKFLRDLQVLLPAKDTLFRIVKNQRSAARQALFDEIHKRLPPEVIKKLDSLLEIQSEYSAIENLKRPVKNASVTTMLDLIERLECIIATEALQIDISDVNNNYQRTLANEVKRCTAYRIHEMKPTRRYTALICFLKQAYQNNIDLLISSYINLISSSYTRSKNKISNQFSQNEGKIRSSLENYEKMKRTICDASIPDIKLRSVILEKFASEFDKKKSPEISVFLKGKKSQIFQLFVKKHAYFRQFTAKFFSLLILEADSGNTQPNILKALKMLNDLNKDNKRNLPKNVPLKFIQKELKKIVVPEKDTIDRHAWECALFLKIKDEIKQGNINATGSKRFSSIKSFFLTDEVWQLVAKDFFGRTDFPMDPKQACKYLTDRLDRAYSEYIESESENNYAKIVNGKWLLTTDPAETLTPEKEQELKEIKSWLKKRMRTIKLPELLVEVDNEIHFTEALAPFGRDSDVSSVEAIFGVLATLMAHGCNIGAYTMPKLINGITYDQICRITDWQFTNDAMRIALSWIVNTMSKLGITRHWGEGKTSSSDAHLKTYKQKVAQQKYQPRFGDFAIAFYTFIADNYAPFHSKPFECTEGEAPHALDGHLYNESDLPLEEHYTDTRAAATIIFEAFAWYGKKYSPRIRGIQNHHIYMIDTERYYGSLASLLNHRDSKVNLSVIEKNWIQMAQFYASIEQGKVTASIALRRLLSLSKKNEFYKANLYLGRILKTEHILQHMRDSEYRKRKHRGLLKGEEIHQLARDINYANRGKITARTPKGQIICCNCLTIIMACIIYWQSKELDILINSPEFAEMGFDPQLVEHISPVDWNNIILYGEYVIDRSMIRA